MESQTSYGKIIKPELCAQYKEKLLSLPGVIHHTELDSIVNSLFACLYTQALQEVSDVAVQKDRILDTKKRERVRSLLEKARATKEETDLKELFSQRTKDSYQIRVIKPGYPPKELGKDLATITNCWISSLRDLNSYHTMRKVEWLQKDIDLGACIFLISEESERKLLKKSYTPKVQTRSYIANTKKEETILFYDTIEGGVISWSYISDWVNNERGRELLYSLAAMIYIAKEYGIKKIGIGEREIQELAARLGFKEETLFGERDYRSRGITEKIGFVGYQHGDEGPYCYGIRESTEKRVIVLDDIKMPSENDIAGRLEDVASFLGCFKKTRKNKNKMEELGVYLECLKVINELNYHSKDISKKIGLLQEEYFKKEEGNSFSF
ncbi:MAG: hypothetical protein Q8N77_06010 [Nanoarchaeota archaeon]|nr:hypothetical protein [Nanoarchaeota archaeon]